VRAIAAIALVLSGCVAAQMQTTLFFGLSRPGGGEIADPDFEEFVQAEIAPRFPRGFTLLEGAGRWRGGDGRLLREPSRLLIVVHAPGDADRLLSEIAARYRARFGQEAVLRTDSEVTAAFQ
jgi:hypothetical protein